MRNAGQEPTADGSPPEDGSTYASAAARRPRRQKQQIVAGAAGVLAVLGIGGTIVASQIKDRPTTVTTANVGALPPLGTDGAASPSPLPGASVPAAGQSAAAGSKPPGEQPTTGQPAAKPPAGQPGTAKPSAGKPRAGNGPDDERTSGDAGPAAVPAPSRTLRAMEQNSKVKDSDVDVDETMSGDRRKRMKVASARADLTGYRELSLITEKFDRVGDTRCTKTIRTSPDVPPRERPTLLLCWRISATKSVYTVAVDMDGKPSRAESVAALEKRWNELG
ncbi:hypothetical protein [Catenuloplanes indicus]|uniref:Uncharacterized protein n=1 Tax=Catenuloplanes indicus TaxID=137267 RepID=A0AAE3W1S8_9ACTN|nr:hypothetical protein [Catenuloplanes indicus]MDQ0368138.1 hypothetical protein [Catenuloplanes indicus]